jgi:RNA polymerase sigma factor (sigma-70 family)
MQTAIQTSSQQRACQPTGTHATGTHATSTHATSTHATSTHATSTHATNTQDVRDRADELLLAEIAFIANPEFAAEDHRAKHRVDLTLATKAASLGPTDLPPHLHRMCETELLTHEQESSLFREMNLSKYQANVIRSRLAPATADEQEILAIEALLKRAEVIRDHIIQANTRLVVAIVKKYVTLQQRFDDMFSDGIVTLMHTVEKSDYDRGFRFSTYAYRPIARSVYRAMTKAQQQKARFALDVPEWAFEQEGDDSTSPVTEQVWTNLRNLTASMLDQLDRRERFIVRCRYALGAHRKVRTFQFLAEKLGISRERVRQIEQRAVAKLRAMADEYDMDDLFSAAMA